MEKLILNILAYLDYLNKKCNFNVSIHFDIKVVQSLPQKALKALLKYNSHTNPYCIAVERKYRNRCLLHQKDIIKNSPNENFCTICHAGVKERIYPIFVGETAIGFATVCGYRENDFIFKIETDGSMPPKEVLLKACDVLDSKADEFITFSEGGS